MPNPDLAGASASALMRAIPFVAFVTATLCAVGPLAAQQLIRQEIQHHGLEQVPAALAMFHQYLSIPNDAQDLPDDMMRTAEWMERA